jgi:type IV pilus assembly protein PilB
MKVEPFLVASTVNVIIAQRLIRKLTDIKERYFLTKPELETLGKSVDLAKVLTILKKEKIVDMNATWEQIPYYRPKKSSESEDGYKGRVVICEVLKVTSTIRALIVSQKTSDDIEVQAKKEGMMTMLEDGIFKAAQGVTTIEEVLRVVSSD